MSVGASIESFLDAYFDGIHRGDVDRLRTVFHPDARLYRAPHGCYESVSLDDWLVAVASRSSPASEGKEMSGEVLFIDRSGPYTAFAKVTLRVGDLRGTDYLSLLCTGGAWRIVSKTFHVSSA